MHDNEPNFTAVDLYASVIFRAAPSSGADYKTLWRGTWEEWESKGIAGQLGPLDVPKFAEGLQRLRSLGKVICVEGVFYPR